MSHPLPLMAFQGPQDAFLSLDDILIIQGKKPLLSRLKRTLVNVSHRSVPVELPEANIAFYSHYHRYPYIVRKNMSFVSPCTYRPKYTQPPFICDTSRVCPSERSPFTATLASSWVQRWRKGMHALAGYARTDIDLVEMSFLRPEQSPLGCMASCALGWTHGTGAVWNPRSSPRSQTN